MRQAIVATSLLVLLTLACQAAGGRGGGAPASGAASPRATPGSPATPAAGLPSPPPPGPVTAAHLTITGASTTRVESTRSRGPCGTSPGGFAAELTFPLDGQPYVLNMELVDYNGPGRYLVPPERVSLHTETGAATPRLAAAVSGSVTVNPDQRSGSIDAALTDRSRVAGTWGCGG